MVGLMYRLKMKKIPDMFLIEVKREKITRSVKDPKFHMMAIRNKIAAWDQDVASILRR